MLVRSLDGMECMDQALIYERRMRKPGFLADFEGLRAKVKDPQVTLWHSIHQRERASFLSSHSSGLVVLFVIGGPGCGKGTQCSMLASHYGSLHLSVGDLLREEADDTTSPYAEFINRSIENSVIIPADLTLRLIEKRCGELGDRQSPILILDGFPRSMEQLHAFEEKVSKAVRFTWTWTDSNSSNNVIPLSA